MVVVTVGSLQTTCWRQRPLQLGSPQTPGAPVPPQVCVPGQALPFRHWPVWSQTAGVAPLHVFEPGTQVPVQAPLAQTYRQVAIGVCVTRSGPHCTRVRPSQPKAPGVAARQPGAIDPQAPWVAPGLLSQSCPPPQLPFACQFGAVPQMSRWPCACPAQAKSPGVVQGAPNVPTAGVPGLPAS